MKITIYKITNTINDKLYIGKTNKCIKKRLAEHFYLAEKGYVSKLNNAIRKYGRDVFTIEAIVENVPEYFWRPFEMYWIHFYDSYNTGYNMTLGGDGGRGMGWSDERYEKIKKSWTNEKRLITGEKSRERWCNFTKEKRQKIRNKQKWSEERKEDFSNLMKEKYKDPNQRLKTSRAMKKVFKETPTLKEKTKRPGKLNGRAKIILIYDIHGRIKNICLGTFVSWCKDNRISFDKLIKSTKTTPFKGLYTIDLGRLSSLKFMLLQ